MPQCAVCPKHVPEDIDVPVSTTMAGTPELDPARGTKRYWEGIWRYFCGLSCRSAFDSRPADYAGDEGGVG